MAQQALRQRICQLYREAAHVPPTAPIEGVGIAVIDEIEGQASRTTIEGYTLSLRWLVGTLEDFLALLEAECKQEAS